MNVTPCFGYYDPKVGSCVGWTRGSPEDRLPCALHLFCRAFSAYLQQRKQTVATYIETVIDADGVQRLQPTMGKQAFARWVQELVVDMDIGRELPTPIVGKPNKQSSTVEVGGKPVLPARKIVRRGPYKTRKARMDAVAKLASTFLETLYGKMEPWRRCEMDAAPAFGQVFLSNIQSGRYLSVYVRSPRKNVLIATIRYYTLTRSLSVTLEIPRDEFLSRLPYNIGRFRKKVKMGKTGLTLIDGLATQEDVVLTAEAIAKLIADGVILLPPQPE